MNISSIGAYSPQKSIGGISKNIGQDIKTLEQERAKLDQDKQKERNPFAIKQSKNFDSIDKKIKDLDNKIQQLKATASSSAKDPDNKVENQQKSSVPRQFDEYVSSKDQPKQPSAGTYSISRNEKGEPVISVK